MVGIRSRYESSTGSTIMIDARFINQEISIFDLVGRLNLHVNRADFMSCPFHEENTPSLKLYKDENSWHCFGCGLGGTVIDFYMNYLESDFRVAFESLCDIYGYEYQFTTPKARARLNVAKKEQERKQLERKQLETKLNYYELKAIDYRYKINRKIPIKDDWDSDLELVEALQNVNYYEYTVEKLRKEVTSAK